jgi:hypothetical protein
VYVISHSLSHSCYVRLSLWRNERTRSGCSGCETLHRLCSFLLSSRPPFQSILPHALLACVTNLTCASSAGESQLVGYPSINITRPPPVGVWTAPPQYPSVALLNWTDGSGTARYWALKLLVDSFSPGAPAGKLPPALADALVNTTASAGGSVRTFSQ